MTQAEQKDMTSNKTIVTLPDGATRTYPLGTTAYDVAKDISPGLAKACVAAKIDGVAKDLSTPLGETASIEFIKRDDERALELIRHDAAHVMAEAVQKLFPGTQVTIGPSIENGFYYDFARDEPFTTDDLPKIEAEMRKIVERASPFIREVWSRDEAIKYFTEKGEMYKVELIRDLPENEELSIYRQGESEDGWLDLCRGPHMPTTKHVGTAFKLMKVAGAYWRGNSDNAMLTRIYGTAWADQKQLDQYLMQLEEAEKRDHRKLGKEMDLFHFQSEAQGSCFWHSKGFTIYNQLENYIRRRMNDAEYDEVKTPQLMNQKFWMTSGHWQKYREDMFVVPDITPGGKDDEAVQIDPKADWLALKPMNCPAHVQIFKQGIRSYKDLPIRYAEFGCCHRNEAHGALHGLMRVRQFTQDDAHIFCREDQILDEAVRFCKLTEQIYKDLGFNDYSVTLETRPEMRVGSDELWDKAEKGLKDALEHIGFDYEIAEGEGTFYGPKIGFIVRDAIGREWGCATLQLDFNLPERFDATYIGEDGDKHRPVMLHRAVLGSLERFIGILIESYAGKLPYWLAPVQCVIATITDDALDYAKDLVSELKALGIRAELDNRNEKINFKVREHSVQKVPFIGVLGNRETEEKTVALRTLGSQKNETFPKEDFLSKLKADTKPPF